MKLPLNVREYIYPIVWTVIGMIIKVNNYTKLSVNIEWDEITLAKSDVQFSVHNLVLGNWNPKKIKRVDEGIIYNSKRINYALFGTLKCYAYLELYL